MQLRALAAATILIPALVALSACSSSSDNDTDTDSGNSASDSLESGGDSDAGDDDPVQDEAPTSEPESLEVADPVDRDLMPQATGEIGEKPEITVPSGDAPDSLQRAVLIDGDGPESQAGDWVQVNYLGQVWGGDVFDNSYDRDSPFTVQVGMNEQRQVVAGWDVGLQGVQADSRVLLSFPPRDGYGADGREPSIGGEDTLIFVVDVLGVYGVDSFGDATGPVEPTPDGWPEVDGELGTVPTVTIPSGLAEPTEPAMTVIAAGNGEPVQPGQLLLQYRVTSWDGELTEQSWPDATGEDSLAGSGPVPFPAMEGTPFMELVGLPMGSRVLLVTPESEDTGVPSAAWVIDIIAQHSATA